ncbi:MAG: hypothetical protein QXL47_03765 [Candidatus Anstonellales archaeon]
MSKFGRTIKRVGERILFTLTPLILSCAFLHRAPKVENMQNNKQVEVDTANAEVVENWWDEVRKRVDVEKELAYWKVVLHDDWVKDTARFVYVVEGTISYREWLGVPWNSLSREEQKKLILNNLSLGTGGKDPEPISPPMPEIGTWK